MHSFPCEILLNISQHLSNSDFCSFSLVARRFWKLESKISITKRRWTMCLNKGKFMNGLARAVELNFLDVLELHRETIKDKGAYVFGFCASYSNLEALIWLHDNIGRMNPDASLNIINTLVKQGDINMIKYLIGTMKYEIDKQHIYDTIMTYGHVNIMEYFLKNDLSYDHFENMDRAIDCRQVEMVKLLIKYKARNIDVHGGVALIL